MTGLRRAILSLLVALAGCSGPTEPPPERPYRAEEVRFRSEGLMLEGTLYLPGGGTPAPAVVIVPGSGPVDRDGQTVPPSGLVPPVYRFWAERMAEEGIAVLRYDKRFLTHPVDPLALSQEDQVRDVVSAVAYLRARPEVDPDRVFIVGHSEGASLAPVAGARTQVRGVVAVAALGFPVDSLVLAQLRSLPEVSDSLVAEVEHSFRLLRAGRFPEGGDILGAGEAYWREWILFTERADSIALALGKPMRVVQGLADENLPGWTRERNVREWEETARRSERIELHTHPGVTHGLLREGTWEVAEPALGEVIAWLRGH